MSTCTGLTLQSRFFRLASWTDGARPLLFVGIDVPCLACGARLCLRGRILTRPTVFALCRTSETSMSAYLAILTHRRHRWRPLFVLVLAGSTFLAWGSVVTSCLAWPAVDAGVLALCVLVGSCPACRAVISTTSSVLSCCAVDTFCTQVVWCISLRHFA